MIDQLIRVYVFPHPEDKGNGYSSGKAVIKYIEAFQPPSRSPISSHVVMMAKTTNSIRLYFPEYYESVPVHSYLVSYGSAGAASLPPPIKIMPGTEFEILGLSPGQVYTAMFGLDVGKVNRTEYTMELVSAAGKATSIPQYQPKGECLVFQVGAAQGVAAGATICSEQDAASSFNSFVLADMNARRNALRPV